MVNGLLHLIGEAAILPTLSRREKTITAPRRKSKARGQTGATHSQWLTAAQRKT